MTIGWRNADQWLCYIAISDACFLWNRIVTGCQDKKNKNVFTLKDVREYANEDIQTISQMFEFVLSDHSKDEGIARIMQDSGYLDLWKADLDKNPWYIDEDKMAEHCKNDVDCLESIAKASCLLSTFYEGLKSQYEELNNKYHLKTLKQQVSLYDNLYKLAARRVYCAGMAKQRLKDGGCVNDQGDVNSLDIFFTEDISQIIP